MLDRCSISFAIHYLEWNLEQASQEALDSLFKYRKRMEQLLDRKAMGKVVKNAADSFNLEQNII